jgi:hypothetical protein
MQRFNRFKKKLTLLLLIFFVIIASIYITYEKNDANSDILFTYARYSNVTKTYKTVETVPIISSI